MKTLEHPTVAKVLSRQERTASSPAPVTAAELRRLCLEAGADDVGFVGIDRPEIAGQRERILAAFPRTRTLISYVCRMNREPIRSPARSVANLEFHQTGDHVDETGRRIVAALEGAGIGALNPAMAFPMEMDGWPSDILVVSHKPVAEAAGLGRMGIHRSVIHPRFGNFILLGTILTEATVDAEDRPVDFNPCLECKLCVAACPVGAIGADGHFDFAACYTHNYREFMSGFTDWVEQIAESRDRHDYRRRVSDPESVSMWQSLSMGANYKAAYCLAVCPAGEDVIGPFLADRKGHVESVVRPLQDKVEPVYVVPESDAEAHVTRRFPHKTPRKVGSGLRPNTIEQFLPGLRLTFQRHRTRGLNAVYHFAFSGAEELLATVTIRDATLHIEKGHHGDPDLRVTADSRTWLGFLAKERSLLWALLRRKIRLQGSPRLLLAFGRCFLA